jgi:hypothetical protein
MEADQPSIWKAKPWWCQPWTIVLTGVVMIGCSWVIVQRWWVTTAVSLMVLVWWVLFLGLVPAAYRRDCENGQHGGTI